MKRVTDASKAGRRGKRQATADRDAAIRRSLEDHAERVEAKRLRTTGSELEQRASAASRLEDLRARILAKAGDTGSTTRATDTNASHGASGSDKPETGDASPRRNELLKMHSNFVATSCESHLRPACAVSSKGDAGDQSRTSAMSSDAANEASRAAWDAVGDECAVTGSCC